MRYNDSQWSEDLENYRIGVDVIWSYLECLHPETTLEDAIESIRSAIKGGII